METNDEQKSFTVNFDGDFKTVECCQVDVSKKWQHVHMTYDPNTGTVLVTGFNSYEDVERYWGFKDENEIEKAQPGDVLRDISGATTVVCF